MGTNGMIDISDILLKAEELERSLDSVKYEGLSKADRLGLYLALNNAVNTVGQVVKKGQE